MSKQREAVVYHTSTPYLVNVFLPFAPPQGSHQREQGHQVRVPLGSHRERLAAWLRGLSSEMSAMVSDLREPSFSGFVSDICHPPPYHIV